MKVAVLFGGNAAEREVSLDSGAAVLAALRARGINASGVDTANMDVGLLRSFDAAFIAVHGRGGEDGTLQGLLESINLPYTGSGVMASSVGMDKVRTKLLWQACALPTPRFRAISGGVAWVDQLTPADLPLMVKPSHEGSSIGMRKVATAGELADAVADAARHDNDVVIEEWVNGAEYTVAVLGQSALPPVRIVTSGDGFYDYAAKYLRDDTRYLCPCGLDQARIVEMQRLALKAFQVVGCRGWGRVDIMQDANGEFRLLEVNTVPGMTSHSLVPMAARAAGIDFPDLVLAVLRESGVMA